VSEVKARALRDEAARLLLQAHELSLRLPEPRPGRKHSIVIFEKRFEEGGEVYRYAVVRGVDSIRWWVSGRTAPTRGLAWDEVLDYVYDRAFSVRTFVVTKLGEVVPTEDLADEEVGA